MAYWLMKTEPDVFSLDDLKNQPGKKEGWDGVRNYQARNNLKSMQVGDQVFFYHSNAKPTGIVGIASVVRTAYPDLSAFDPKSPYFDPKSKRESPQWVMVDVRYESTFSRIITLDELKKIPALADWALVQKGNRLSVLPVTPQQWKTVMGLL